METKNPIKSKTINGNIIASAILLALPHFGIPITEEISVIVLGVGNILLRFLTNGKIGFKAVSLEKKLALLYKAYLQLKKDVETLKEKSK
jgi:hypothetical protein